MSITSGYDLDELIGPDQVHGSLYTDPQLFEDELEKIWYRTWVFVGHVSEVPEPGDYVLKAIGPQSVIMTRDKQGEIHLLQNRCTHRGERWRFCFLYGRHSMPPLLTRRVPILTFSSPPTSKCISLLPISNSGILVSLTVC